MEKNKEKAKEVFQSWIKDLEEQEQPESCNTDDEDCESCGS